MYKKVCMPITVPEGDYCWNYETMAICEHFDNEGGHPSCDLGHHIKDIRCPAEDGVHKADDCLAFKELKKGKD